MKMGPRSGAGVFLALLVAGPAFAQNNPGTTGAQVLQVPLGARALGMGTAFTAVASDDSALEYNPAGLSLLNAQDLEVTYIAGAGQSSLQQLTYGGPTPYTGLTGNGYTSGAGSVLLSQDGSITVNTLNANGTLAGSSNINAGSDLVLEAGYSERIGMTPYELKDGTYDLDHFVGVGVKYLHSTLVQSYSANAAAVDVGYLVRQPQTGWTFGASALNLGTKIKYSDEADPLPATARAGVAWEGGEPGVHNLIVAADSDYELNERIYHINAGVEYFWLRTYGLRLGYQFNRPDQGGLTLGFGFRWKGRFLVDYGWAVGDQLGNGQRFTLAYRFAGVPPSARAKVRQPYIESSPEREPVENIDQARPDQDEPAPTPRAVPRDREGGVPGWIY
jgi:hypothetical protein